MTSKIALGVLVSGSGSNLQAILEATQSKDYPAYVAVVLCNVPGVKAILRAQKFGVPVHVVSHKDFSSKEDFENALLEKLKAASVETVVLAGFMRLLSPFFIRHYPQRIINIHPALLPQFPGTHSIQRAFEAKVPETGVTVHFVDEGMDTGPIIRQKKIIIEPQETLASLEDKIHKCEHKLYPEVIRDLSMQWLQK